MIIRRAVESDAPAIAVVLYKAFAEYESLYTPEGFAATTPASDIVRARMREGPVWVALLNDLVVGTVSAVPKGEGLYVRGMAVLPTVRGRGIGEALLRQVEDYALDTAARYLLLSTTPFLADAIRLYEHYGFHRSDAGPHDLFGTPLFTMTKSLIHSNLPLFRA